MATVNPKFAQNGDEKGKVFIGGLSWETTTASMLKYFSRYGEVIDCVVMKNQQTGKSRGFGFVKFRDPSCVETVLSNGPHILDGRQIDPKACNPRSMNKGSHKTNEAKNKNKIFLGGLPSNCTESQIKEVFSQFGKVECKRAEPRELKELNFQLATGGLYANGALGMPGMALGPGIISSPYQSLAAQQHFAATQGIALLPAGPHLIPLTIPGAGGLNMPGGAPGMYGPSESEPPTAWPSQMPMSGSAYISHPGSQLGASQTSLGIEQYTTAPQQDSPPTQVQGYHLSASPVPGSTTPIPQGSDEQMVATPKAATPYVLYGNQANQLGILGSYPQEASSYGPARGYAQGGVDSGIQTPYTASVTYAAAPGLALQQASPYVGTLGNGYSTGVPLSFAYGGHGDASAAAYTAALQAAARNSSLAQGFHPYRR